MDISPIPPLSLPYISPISPRAHPAVAAARDGAQARQLQGVARVGDDQLRGGRAERRRAVRRARGAREARTLTLTRTLILSLTLALALTLTSGFLGCSTLLQQRSTYERELGLGLALGSELG